MLIVDENADVKRKLSDEELKMMEVLKKSPAVPDENCPELTDEQLRQLA